MNTLKVYFTALMIVISLLVLCLNLSKKAPCSTLESATEKSEPKITGGSLENSAGIYTLKFNSFKYADCY